MRRGQHPLRRRQGRRDLRSPAALPRRTGADHAPLYRRADRFHRAGKGRPRAGHEHQRADHGVDHGHLLDAHAPHRDGGGHRQAARSGRFARAPRGHRPGLHDRHLAGAETIRAGARVHARRRPGTRQRRRHGLQADARAGLQDRFGHRSGRRGLQPERDRHSEPPGTPPADRLDPGLSGSREDRPRRGHVPGLRRAAARGDGERHHFAATRRRSARRSCARAPTAPPLRPPTSSWPPTASS